MNVFADESVDRSIVERLRIEGHDVIYVAELSPGISDDEVLEQANRTRSVLLTADKDFGELIFRLSRVHDGVVLIRLLGLSAEVKAGVVAEALRDRSAEIPRRFTVISPGMVRIRREL